MKVDYIVSQLKGTFVIDKRKNKKISIQLNAITNYIGQSYTIAIAIIITPFYLQYLGAEAYGLIGFFMVMQNWLNLLDMGLSSTLGRQVAYARGQINGFDKFKSLLRSFELIFFGLTACIVVCVYFGRNWIARSWIKSNTLNIESISYCIVIMGLIIALRFFSTVYRSGINGFEDQVWINKFGVGFSTLKYIGSFLILAYISNDIEDFFKYQLVVGIFELTLLWGRFYSNLPAGNVSIAWLKIDWSIFLGILPFSLGIAYASVALTLITQFDKLLLSGFLSLEDFGYFSLVTLVAGSIVNLATPIFIAFLPRMTIFVSKNNSKELIAMYVNMTQIITWITLSTAILICMYSQEILYFLTGDRKASVWGHEILTWYVLGSGVYVLGVFQYYLQNAFGALRLHIIGSTISLLVQIPLIYIVTMKYGALGAGRLWFAFNLVWFLAWTWVVHNKFIQGFHFKWLIKDLLPIVSIILILSSLLGQINFVNILESRLIIVLKIILTSTIFLLLTSIGVRSIRCRILGKLERRYG